ncbi:hypothetical protein [Chloroflexus sp.]|uniref:hypothetical protein n=1 Tax=Chloroflexus sp. TaxID=1904827 RepID=UPI00263A38C6|nr:hypothetical protein [uncultured Chloroflexus sp.]
MSDASVFDPKILRRDLLLEAAIERRLDLLVKQASETATLLEGKAMEKNQLRNLQNVAMTSRSPEVIINFIRYQIAREGSKWGEGQNDFGHKLICQIRQTIKSWAQDVANEVLQAMNDVPDREQLFHQAYVRLIQLFIGYLNRAFYYAIEVRDGFQHLRELVNA